MAMIPEVLQVLSPSKPGAGTTTESILHGSELY